MEAYFGHLLLKRTTYTPEEIRRTLDHMSDWINNVSDSPKGADLTAKFMSMVDPTSPPQTRRNYDRMTNPYLHPQK